MPAGHNSQGRRRRVAGARSTNWRSSQSQTRASRRAPSFLLWILVSSCSNGAEVTAGIMRRPPVIGEDAKKLGGREQKNPGCAGWPCRPGQQLRGRSRPEKWPLARWWAPRGRPGRRIDRSGMTRRTRRRLSYLIHPLSQINSCLILRISLHLHGLVGHNTRHYSSEETLCFCCS